MKDFCRMLLVLMLAMVLGACASTTCRNCHANGHADAPVPPATCGDAVDLATADTLGATVTGKKSADILLLSGGGSRGSFSAGILEGWGSSRPDFELVTGVSVGAILATWAYLGPGEHPGGDPYVLMEESFGGHLDSSQIIKRRWLFPLVDSLYSLAPMKKTFRQVLPAEMILEVGRIYRETGRQLWIGTTNLESGQFCQWNLGKLALAAVSVAEDANLDDNEKHRRIDDIVSRYYDLVIASSANPTVFQSVKIDGEVHVDGGVSHTIFTTRLADIINAVVQKRPELADKEFNVFAVVNGRLVTSRKCPSSNVVGLAMRSISILSKSAERANLDRIKVMIDEALQGKPWNYRTAWLDDDIHLDPADVFTKQGMGDLYRHGEDFVSNGGRWCAGGPRSDVEPGDLCYLPTTFGTACD